MRKKLNVLSIDGIVGVGKTTQINMVRNLLKREGIDSKTFDFQKQISASDLKEKLLTVYNYIKNNQDTVVLLDGSVATTISQDYTNMMNYEQIYKKYKESIQIYEDMNSKFNFVNFILSPLDINMCDSRLVRKSNLFKTSLEIIENKSQLNTLKDALKNFQNLPFNWNISFNVLDIDEGDSIMTIHSSILTHIKKEYQIVKPSM